MIDAAIGILMFSYIAIVFNSPKLMLAVAAFALWNYYDGETRGKLE